jgi:hypothetical protein
MSGPVGLDALDLATLLCSRVCHDLINLTGAIVNGLTSGAAISVVVRCRRTIGR